MSEAGAADRFGHLGRLSSAVAPKHRCLTSLHGDARKMIWAGACCSPQPTTQADDSGTPASFSVQPRDYAFQAADEPLPAVVRTLIVGFFLGPEARLFR
jgi:hypothetical protein